MQPSLGKRLRTAFCICNPDLGLPGEERLNSGQPPSFTLSANPDDDSS
jgi:hypothetical protein